MIVAYVSSMKSWMTLCLKVRCDCSKTTIHAASLEPQILPVTKLHDKDVLQLRERFSRFKLNTDGYSV